MATILENVNSKSLFLFSIFLKIIDICSTAYIISIFGTDAERNPFVRKCIDGLGLVPTLLFISLVFVGVIGYLYIKNKKDLLVVVVILMMITVLINIYSILQLSIS